MDHLLMSWQECSLRLDKIHESLSSLWPLRRPLLLYPIPRGGVHVAAMLVARYPNLYTTSVSYEDADAVIDDLLDSGSTMERVNKGCKPFFVLLDKQEENEQRWVTFPWELQNNEAGPEDAVVRLLQYIGENPKRDGLRDTPKRVVRSYAELFSGYAKQPEDVMTTFDQSSDEMVIVRNAEFCSTCEHHMLPFVGVAHIAYLPKDRVIGVSKLVRLLHIYTRRLQIQERICEQVTTALDTYLQPLGSACVLEAKHMCMSCRGVNQQGSSMITSSLTGAFKDDPRARSEFLSMIK